MCRYLIRLRRHHHYHDDDHHHGYDLYDILSLTQVNLQSHTHTHQKKAS